MARYKLSGQITIRGESPDGDDIKDHKEVVTAEDETEAVEVSLTGFTEEQEPGWMPGFTVERVFRFTFQAHEIVLGKPSPIHIEPFIGTHAEMEAYIAEKTRGIVLYDGILYTQDEP